MDDSDEDDLDLSDSPGEDESGGEPEEDDEVDADLHEFLSHTSWDNKSGERGSADHVAMAAFKTRKNLKRNPLDPLTFKEAMEAPDAEKFLEALERELASLKENKTFTVVDLPRGAKPITSRVIFKRKVGHDGEVKVHKARLVARGFQQKEGIDYDETFAAVVRPCSYRILLALTAVYDWHVEQMDVKTAFLNGVIDKTIYMRAPKGMKLPKGKVLRLLRTLYGLKQSPRVWWSKFTETLTGWGWRVNDFDPCVFISDDGQLFLCLWVDDILIFGKSIDRINQFKAKLSTVFQMTDEGECKYYLGIHVERKPGVVHLH